MFHAEHAAQVGIVLDAAAKAWGWNKKFLDVGMRKQSIAQPAKEQSIARLWQSIAQPPLGKGSYQYVKSSLYGTIVMRMVMDACEAVFEDLPSEEQKLGFQAVRLQVNRGLGEPGNLARLLLSESATRPCKTMVASGSG